MVSRVSPGEFGGEKNLLSGTGIRTPFRCYRGGGYIYIYIYLFIYLYIFIHIGATAPQLAMASSFMRFLDHTQRRTAFGRTPLDE